MNFGPSSSDDCASQPCKKQRLESDDTSSASTFMSGSGGFSFGFNLASVAEEEKAADVALPVVDADIPVPQSYAVLLRDVSGIGSIHAKRGDIVKIDWLKSTNFDLYVTVCTIVDRKPVLSSNRGLISSSVVAMLPYQTPTSQSHVVEIDTVFDPPTKITSNPHFCSTPLTVEPGLQSMIWPMTTRTFLTDIFKKKCLVIHGTGERLSQLKEDFHNFDVRRLLETSSKSIIWMRTKQGKMQYIDANPEVGLNAYMAGHTLYFNPDVDTQTRYISALCQELAINFGCEREYQGCGGDLEVFAVNGTHTTSWHFDAQENFSVQLVGTKKWTIVPADATDVITNLHAGSTNRASVCNDLKVHTACGGVPNNPCLDVSGPTPVLDLDNHPQKQVFIARPGTFFYHPAGFYHKVEALDEGGSLSINLSLDTMRWMELLLSRLTQLLFKHSLWRQRIQVLPGQSPLAHMQAMLADLPTLVAQLTAADFMPPALLLEGRSQDQDDKRYRAVRLVHNDSSLFVCHRHDFTSTYTFSTAHTLQYNPLVTLTRAEPAFYCPLLGAQATSQSFSLLESAPAAAPAVIPSGAEVAKTEAWREALQLWGKEVGVDADEVMSRVMTVPLPLPGPRAQATWFAYIAHSGFGQDGFTSAYSPALLLDIAGDDECVRGVVVEDAVAEMFMTDFSVAWVQMLTMEMIMWETVNARGGLSVDKDGKTVLNNASKYTLESLSRHVLYAFKLLMLQKAVLHKYQVTFDQVMLDGSIKKAVNTLLCTLVHLGVLRAPIQ